MKTYRFYKQVSISDGSTKWFIDIPKFPFNKAWLEMVLGADDLLDKLAQDKKEIKLSIGTKCKEKDYTDLLRRTHKLGIIKGAIYKTLLNKLKNNGIGKNNLWLCPATLWVFLRYPKKIYIKIVD